MNGGTGPGVGTSRASTPGVPEQVLAEATARPVFTKGSYVFGDTGGARRRPVPGVSALG